MTFGTHLVSVDTLHKGDIDDIIIIMKNIERNV
jgi:hypothetical protein